MAISAQGRIGNIKNRSKIERDPRIQKEDFKERKKRRLQNKQIKTLFRFIVQFLLFCSPQLFVRVANKRKNKEREKNDLEKEGECPKKGLFDFPRPRIGEVCSRNKQSSKKIELFSFFGALFLFSFLSFVFVSKGSVCPFLCPILFVF